MATKYYASKAVSIAKSEVGYLEKTSNNNLENKTSNVGHNNYNKYARDLDEAKWFNGSKNGYDWCTSFATWVFYQLTGKNVKDAKNLCFQPQNSSINYAAGCGFARNYYKNNKAFYTSNPKAGDQIFFDWSGKKGFSQVDHTGIVVKVDNAKVYTVEGNTYSGNKEGVFEHSYSLTDNCIVGYGRPKYDAEPITTTSEVTTTKNTTSTKTSTSKTTTTKYKVGDTVTFKKIYGSSDSTKPLNPAIKSGKITKISNGAKNPYLINNGTGWVNDSVITTKNATSTAASKTTTTTVAATKKNLTVTPAIGVNVREKSTTTSKIVCALVKGTSVIWEGKSKANGGYTWYYITVASGANKGKKGYVAKDFLK